MRNLSGSGLGKWIGESSSAATDLEQSNYIQWLETHPSALEYFDEMMNVAKGKSVMVFLDYDGTLTPIVNDPSQAFMTEEMRLAVKAVANRFPTGIISGRSLEKVQNFVKLRDYLYFAGSHGMDIEGCPTKGILQGKAVATTYQAAVHFLDPVKKIFERLRNETSHIEGSKVEDNKFCVSVHYRNLILPSARPSLENIVLTVLEEYPNFEKKDGNMVFEIRPAIPWNKGKALLHLLETLKCLDSDIFPIFIGDDTTDEDGFKVLQGIGKGSPILVSTKPKDTAARFSLRNTLEVQEFLDRLSKWDD